VDIRCITIARGAASREASPNDSWGDSQNAIAIRQLVSCKRCAQWEPGRLCGRTSGQGPCAQGARLQSTGQVGPEAPTGFYVGAHIGGGWTHNTFTDPTGIVTMSALSASASEFLGGVQAGYNWQFSNFVLGIQGDISFTDMNARNRVDPTTLRNDTKWISTLTGRAGYAWDKTLWYAKGGEAWVRNHYALINTTAPLNATERATRSGYVVGGGWEYAFAPTWSGFVEYDYIGLSSKDVNLLDPAAGAMTLGTRQNIQMVKAGLNFKLTSWPRWQP
jgi:outer membrane immunogenic protein